MKLEFPFPIWEKYLNIKVNENTSGGSRVVYAVGQTDRQTDMTKLTVDFRNFANAPKNGRFQNSADGENGVAF